MRSALRELRVEKCPHSSWHRPWASEPQTYTTWGLPAMARCPPSILAPSRPGKPSRAGQGIRGAACSRRCSTCALRGPRILRVQLRPEGPGRTPQLEGGASSSPTAWTAAPTQPRRRVPRGADTGSSRQLLLGLAHGEAQQQTALASRSPCGGGRRKAKTEPRARRHRPRSPPVLSGRVEEPGLGPWAPPDFGLSLPRLTAAS